MKINSVFGPMSGRLGNLSMSVRGGVQIIRTINTEPKNPRTQGQMAQRVQLSNIVSAYKALSPFLKDSYPDRPLNLSRYNVFVKNNLNKVKVYLDKTEAGRKACAVAPYNISQGSLASIEASAEGDRIVSSLRVPEAFDITGETTLGGVSKALLFSNPDFISGDRLSVVRLVQTFSLEREVSVPGARLEVYEFSLNVSSPLPFHMLVPLSLFGAENGRIGTAEGIEAGGIAYVRSRESGNRLLVSTQSLVMTPNDVTYGYYSSEEKRILAAGSYGAAVPCFADPSSVAPAPEKPVTVGAIPCGCPDVPAHEDVD